MFNMLFHHQVYVYYVKVHQHMLGIHQTYVRSNIAHPLFICFQCGQSFQHLKSDILELMRNVKLHTSNLHQTYVQHMCSISHCMTNVFLVCPHMPKVLSIHKTIFGRLVERHMRTYHSVPLLYMTYAQGTYNICQHTATWNYLTYVGICLHIFACVTGP